MKRKELLLLAIGIFLTIISSLVIDIYNLRLKAQAQEKGPTTEIKNYRINKELLKVLESKTE